MLELKPGDHFAGCRIISLCGKGGFGTVYLAEDGVGKKVAVKIIHTPDKERELQGIRRYMPAFAHSPYLLPIYHVGVEQDELYLIMEAADPLTDSAVYLPDTLGKRLRLRGRLSPEETLDMIRKIASAVDALHKSGLIHRDIKPDNVIFSGGEPMLSDPGLICSSDCTVSLAGTLGFLPPECFANIETNSVQSDIYALGKLFYCTVTGEAPGRFPYFPGDLSFPLCRKLLPVLLKACNTKKKKRYDTIGEFLHDLPEKLPRPGWLMRFNEKFRIWRLMHIRLYYTALAALLVCIAAAGFVISDHYKNRHRREQEIAMMVNEKNLFLKKLTGQKTQLRLQLEHFSGISESRKYFAAAEKLPEKPANAVKLCRKYETELNAIALNAVEKIRKIADPMNRIAEKMAFLKSPLGAFLTKSRQEELKRDIAADRKASRAAIGSRLRHGRTFMPDSSGIFEFNYIPPGDFISPLTGKKERINYPLWVSPEKLTVRQFSRLCNFIPPRNRGLDKPATAFLWNDLINGCRRANEMFQVIDSFPPGYIVRPLTEKEWQYCALNGMYKLSAAEEKKFDGKNIFGLYDILSNNPEIVQPEGNIHTDSITIFCGRRGLNKKVEAAFYQSFMRSTGSRIAVAPGNADFYERSVFTGSAQHLVFNGRHYEFFGHLNACFTRKDAEKICRMLGGRLASLDSKELLEKIYNTASPVVSYNVCVAADFKNGKWYWANGKEVENAPPPPKKGENITFKEKKFSCETYKRHLAFICEWSQEEWNDRQNWQKRNSGYPEYVTFSIDGRSYALFTMQSSLYPHLCRRFAEIIGGKLAEIDSADQQKKIFEKIRNFSDKPVLLGGFWKNEDLFWFSGRKITPAPAEMKGQLIDNAPSLSVPALHDGKLCTIQLASQFLVEFPAGWSNH